MDTIVYLTTAAVTVIWSVWIYLWWESRAGLAEENGLRLALIVAPSSYFLLIAVSGWAEVRNLRLDLAGLVFLDVVTVIVGILLSTLLRFPGVNRRRSYLVLLGIYNAIALVEIAFLYIARSQPGMTVRVAQVVGEWERLDFLSFGWLGGHRQPSQPDLVGLLNKLIIALLTYVPVSIIRYIGSVRRRRRLERELALLKSKVELLERQIGERSLQ